MESLGYKKNKEQFKQLASIVSVNDIGSLIPPDASVRQRSKMIQALFFGMAGLLPGQNSLSKKNMDKHSLKYIKEVGEMWYSMKNNIKSKSMDGGL